jgi:hypothetical protein
MTAAAVPVLQAAASSVLQPPRGGDLPDDAVVSSDDPPQVRFLRSHARDPLQTGTTTLARDTSQRGFVPYQVWWRCLVVLVLLSVNFAIICSNSNRNSVPSTTVSILFPLQSFL